MFISELSPALTVRGLWVANAPRVLKLTRLNRNIVAVNPDHISWIDAMPDTTLCLIGGEKLLVRETLDELIDRLVEFRRLIRHSPAAAFAEGDLPPAEALRSIRRGSLSSPPPSGRKEA
jgi:flagellar protein FlbD